MINKGARFKSTKYGNRYVVADGPGEYQGCNLPHGLMVMGTDPMTNEFYDDSTILDMNGINPDGQTKAIMYPESDVIALGIPTYPGAIAYGVGYGSLIALDANGRQIACFDGKSGWQQ